MGSLKVISANFEAILLSFAITTKQVKANNCFKAIPGRRAVNTWANHYKGNASLALDIKEPVHKYNSKAI